MVKTKFAKMLLLTTTISPLFLTSCGKKEIEAIEREVGNKTNSENQKLIKELTEKINKKRDEINDKNKEIERLKKDSKDEIERLKKLSFKQSAQHDDDNKQLFRQTERIKELVNKLKTEEAKSLNTEKELISHYLAQLAGEKYTDLDNFVNQFDDPTWKNDKNNLPTIEKLAKRLNCSVDELNANKIKDLGVEKLMKWKD